MSDLYNTEKTEWKVASYKWFDFRKGCTYENKLISIRNKVLSIQYKKYEIIAVQLNL